MANWFYERNGERLGPFTCCHLRRQALAGALLPNDLIYRDGMGRWVPAGAVRGLFGLQRRRPHRRPIDPLCWGGPYGQLSRLAADYDFNSDCGRPDVTWAVFGRLLGVLLLVDVAVGYCADAVTTTFAPEQPAADDPNAGMYIIHDPTPAPATNYGSKP
jgi:GYF domain 2